MKRFLKTIILFAVFASAIDFAFGALFPFLREKAKGGRTQEEYYIAEECESEILILGSSRALHHYIPSIIQESLGLTCYNCGKDGMGSLLAYARYSMITDRYNPKLIIYDVAPAFDYSTGEDNTKYLGTLKPFYYKDCVKKIIAAYSEPDARLLMNSQMYRNNSCILSCLIDCFIYRHYSDNGYQPIYGKIENKDSKNSVMMEDETLEIDWEKIKLIEEMIQDCKSHNIAFVFVMSPVYGGQYSNRKLQPVIDLATKYEIPFLDFSDAEEIVNDYTYFQDRTHMNDSGARIYSKIVADAIIEYNVFLIDAQEE